MGVAGVSIKILLTVDDIKDALKKNGGIVRQAARSLNVNKNVIYEFINEHNLQTYLEHCRTHGDEELLDGSFASLMYNLDRLEKNPKIALETAKYVIDKIGHKRKWNNQSTDLTETNILLKNISDDLKKSHPTVIEE